MDLDSDTMNDASILASELSVIEQIVRDETWYEGERRGCYVSPDDPVVREHVCEVVLRIGAELRASLTRNEPAQCQAA